MNSSNIGITASSLPKIITSVKRACDACHRRKVKCDGVHPCRNCSSAQLTCTYHAIPQKKGPKGSRAKVISELRETQRQTTLSSKAIRPPYSPNYAPTPGLLSPDVMNDCVDFFFTHLYATLPILHRPRVEQQMAFAEQNVDAYCLLSALCAFTMIQPGMGMPGDSVGLDSMPGSNLVTSTMLVEETLRVRKNYDHTESPSLNTLCTSFFIFACHHALELQNKAWYHLREATTLALIMGMQKEESYVQCDVVESSRRRRLYWLLFMTERAYALQRQRPVSLSATIALPNQRDDPSDCQAHALQGFTSLVSLYRPFDDNLISLWNKTRNTCSPSYIVALQKQLNDAVPGYLSRNENPNADLLSSQQWLRTTVWQLSMQSNSEDSKTRFQYPNIPPVVPQFAQQDMGTPLLVILFSTSCLLTDYLSLLPQRSSDPFPFTLGPLDQLHQLMTLLSILHDGDTRFLPLLLTKVHDLLPLLADPSLQSVPEGVCNTSAEVDIFDGFGNAGISIPPQHQKPYSHLSIPPQTHSHHDYKMGDQNITSLNTTGESPPNSRSSSNSNSDSQTSQLQHSPDFTSPHPQHGFGSTHLDLDYPHMDDYTSFHIGVDQHHRFPASLTTPELNYSHEYKQEYNLNRLAPFSRAPSRGGGGGSSQPHSHAHHGGSFNVDMVTLASNGAMQLPPVGDFAHGHGLARSSAGLGDGGDGNGSAGLDYVALGGGYR